MILLILIACLSAPATSAEPSRVRSLGWTLGGSSAVELTLDDGTICIITSGGGIDCNWEKK